MLKDFLLENKEIIIEKWINLLKTDISSRYKSRPVEELRQTISLAFQGNYEVIVNNNWQPINDFIKFITKLRLERGFTLSEVQMAFGLFRVILIEMLPMQFQKEELKEALKLVNFSVDVTINKFSEYFQKKHDEDMEEMLRFLETKVRERTEELKNSEKRYKTLVEDINDGYFVGKNGKIIFANNALCKMFQYSKKEIINMPYSKLIKIDIDNSDTFETVGIKKNGENFPVEIKSTQIIFENEVASAGICRDITERHKSEENEKLAIIGRLSTAFAHELRNSLSSIKINMHILKDKFSLNEIDKKRVNLIFRDIEKLDKILKDTFCFVKPIEPNLEKVAINDFIDEFIKNFNLFLNSSNINIVLNLEKRPINLYLDKEKMEIVFTNILYNSIDALKSKKGKKFIKISTKFLKDEKECLIEIWDNGIGIDRKYVNEIFKPFFTTKSNGMGLGLANVEKIVSLHNGRIEIDTLLKKYTKFRIFIPCQ